MAGSIGATPMAVLAGSALIAAAIYFGLRARPVVVAPSETALTAASAAVAEPPTPSTSTPPAPAPLPATALSLRFPAAAPGPADVASDVRVALERQRSDIVAQCWAPAVATKPTPASSTYEFNFAFDEQGNEAGRGVSEIDLSSRPDVARCIRTHGVPVSIPPRGVRTSARVRMTLP